MEPTTEGPATIPIDEALVAEAREQARDARHEAMMAELVARLFEEVGHDDWPEMAVALACRHFRMAIPKALEARRMDPACLAGFSVRNAAPF